MAGLVPIPSNRISDLFVQQRLTKQFQSDQLDLFRLQDQISTGQRIILPSDDAPAALRAITLQRLLERKSQLQSNVQTGMTFLAATDTALNDIASSLGDIRGATLGVAGTTSSQQERESVVAEVNRAIEQLVQTGNRKFRGRYLFTGSQTSTQPYEFEDTFVKYLGNEKQSNSYSDINILFATNSPGSSVFGGISSEVQSSADLNPEVNAATLLSSLRGSRGISPNGALLVSDGTNSSVVDISSASTLGDVARFIEENSPTGRQVTATITGQGLTLQLDAAGGGNLTVTEVGSGKSARELGILEESGVLTNPLVGSDLDPALLRTSQLSGLLGTKAQALVTSAGFNNDILIEAVSNGTQYNGATVQFVDDDLLLASPGLVAGNESAVYDTNARAASAAITFAGTNNDLILQANTLGTSFNNVRIDVTSTASGGVPTASYDTVGKVLAINLESDGTSNANQIIAAIAGLAGNPFTVSLDTSVESSNDGTGAIAVVNQAGFANSGNSGGAANTLYVHVDPGVTTASDAVAAIVAEGTFSAGLAALDSSTVVQAGTGVVALASTATFSGGSGTQFDQSSGIQVVNGGETYALSFAGAETVEDLLNILNGSEAGLQAEINAAGTGIDIRSRLNGSDFQIGENGGQTATQLGIRTYTDQTKLSEFNYGTGVPTGDGFELPTTTGVDLSITTIDGQTFDVDLSSAQTLSDVANAINAVTTTNVTAQFAPPGNILELVDNTVGVGQLTVTQATGSLAAQYLGLVADGNTVGTSGTGTLTGNDSHYIDFTITSKDGQTFGIDLSQATTVDDAINAINAITTTSVTARLAINGNGIELVDATGGSGDLIVTQNTGSRTAELLGLVPDGQTQANSTTNTLQSEDRNYLETDSVFTTLIRLRDALVINDISAIERAIAKIDGDIDRVSFARAEVGARQQGLDLTITSLQNEDIQLRGALSDQIDVDLVEAISSFTARQTSLEASLRATASILQLSLLNFI